jgi:hypothetical protein
MRSDMAQQYDLWTRAFAKRTRYRRISKADEADDEIDNNAIGSTEDTAGGGRDHHLSRLVDLMVEAADGELSRAEALNWLLHDRNGVACAQRHKRDTTQQKGF